MNDDDLRRAIAAARDEASKVGPLHAMWDVIFDAEAILEGRPAILSREQNEKYLASYLTRSST